jgi:hypothetical protein
MDMNDRGTAARLPGRSPCKTLPLLLAAGFLATAHPASALSYVTTWTGQVTSGDDAGLFGINGDARDYDFTAVFRVDTSLGGGFSGNRAGYTPSNPSLGSITINGVTLQLGDYFGAVSESLGILSNYTNYSQNQIFNQSGSIEGGDFVYLYQDTVLQLSADSLTAFVDGDITTAPDPTLSSVSNMTGSVGLSRNEYVEGAGYVQTSIHLTLAPTRLAVSTDAPAGPVPEPGAWALLILGFGSAGAILRRRRSLAVV